MKIKFSLKSKCSLSSNIYWYCETGSVSKDPRPLQILQSNLQLIEQLMYVTQ